MSKLPSDDLNEYSRRVVPLILARFPEWERLGIIRSTLNGSGYSVLFEIPCPSLAVEMGLWASTENEELTIGFHTHHGHFNDYGSGFNPALIEAGLDRAAAYLEDRLGVLSWYQDGRLASTSSEDLPLDGPLPRPFTRPLITRCTLRSWSGRFDRDESGI